ncbi:hypothetical protein SLEP1_g16963 [Rubroshorea leprosula]|uniref:Uncharacterized protein n=1 Tax=Rubroshorea leprosula TaxID=152421 RepID=A0AAV5J1U5_9ROSI|nr:hypothetical protein SLEP1_g16963 [Rubroshorea leprosula]
MGKVTFLLAFSLVVFLSIQTVWGNVVDGEKPDLPSGLSLDELSATGENFARSAGDALEGVMESSPSWTDWAKEKFDGLGFNDWLSSLTSPAPGLAPLAAPVSAPVSARKIAPHYAPGPSPTSVTGLASDLVPESAGLASNLAMEPAAADAPALAPRA